MRLLCEGEEPHATKDTLPTGISSHLNSTKEEEKKGLLRGMKFEKKEKFEGSGKKRR